MSNPYHNGAGRFCSKGEMRSAIDTALNANDIDLYFTLRKDYEVAAQESLTVNAVIEPEASFTEKLILSEGASRSLAESLRSNDSARRIKKMFTNSGVDLTETQVSLLSDSLYHIRRAGYHKGSTGEGDATGWFDKNEATTHIITRLGISARVHNEDKIDLANEINQTWKSGIYSGKSSAMK